MYDSTKPYKEHVLELIQSTWQTSYVSIKKDIYPVVKRNFPCTEEVDHTDGIGTKGIYHWKKRTFRNAVLDSLAMNLNDLAIARATPYKLQNHIIIPEDDKEAILKIIEALAEECKKRNIAITGGETSIHDNINGLEISVTASGFIKTRKSNKFRIEDVLIGIESSGLHSNGFTRLREVFGREYREDFVMPAHIYSGMILDLNEKYDLHGMMHITGGAYTKLKDLLDNADAQLTRNHKLKPQQIFLELYERGIPDEEMYRTFNCGTGFVLSVSQEDANEVVLKINESGFEADKIGKIIPGNKKIKLKSMFSDKEIEL